MQTKNIITVTSPLLPDLSQFHELLEDIWQRKWITNMGEYHKRLEQALADYLHVPYVCLFTNQKSIENLETFQKKLEFFEKKIKKNTEYYQNLVKYYGYKEKDKIYEKNEVFFKMLLTFFAEINKAMPKLDVKRMISIKNRVVGKKFDQSALMNNLMSQLKQRVRGNN